MQLPGQIVAVSTTPPNVRGSHNCLKRLRRLPRLSDREMNWCFLWFSSEILTWCPRRECFRPTKRRRAKEVPACSSASQRPGIKYQSDKGTQMTNFHSDMIIAWYSGTSPGECVPWLVRPLQSHPPSTGKPPPIKDLLSDLFSWKIVFQHEEHWSSPCRCSRERCGFQTAGLGSIGQRPPPIWICWHRQRSTEESESESWK